MDESSRRDRFGHQRLQGQGEALDPGGKLATGNGESWLEPKEPPAGRRHEGDVQSRSEGRERRAPHQVDQGRRQGALMVVERCGERLRMRNRLCWSAVWLLGILGFISGCSAKNAGKQISQVPDLSGIWLGKAIQSLSPSDPTAQKPGAEGDIPYTPWAIARMKAERPATGRNQTFANTTDPALKYADPDGYPRASIHPMRFKIVQTPDYIYQIWEYNKSWRQIALNRPHSEVPDISWFGESVGRWDGDTLVVDSIGFKDSTWLDFGGHPHSEALKVTERIKRGSFGQLDVEVRFEDAKYYKRAWTVPSKGELVTDTEM